MKAIEILFEEHRGQELVTHGAKTCRADDFPDSTGDTTGPLEMAP